MQFSLYVSARPTQHRSSAALKFAQAVLQQGHCVYRVFFFDEAVLSASENLESAGWRALRKDSDADLCLCSASAVRNELDLGAYTQEFSVGGLVQLVDAQLHSDRLISFS